MFNRLRNLLFRRSLADADMQEEVDAFFETMKDRYLAQGLTEQEARRLTRLKFSSSELVKENVRDARPGAAFESLLRDISYSLRRLRKAPVFAAVIILTLAAGIGANATIFSLVSRFVLRPAPVANPSSLLALHTSHRSECCNHFSWPLLNDVREQSKSFSGVAAYYELIPASINGTGEPERVWGQATTTNFFDVAQLNLILGRGFLRSEDTTPVVVLGYRLWQRRFSGDPAILGKTILLSGRSFTVVGIAPSAFHGIDQLLDCQFWVPLGVPDQLLPSAADRVSYNFHWLAVIARLQPGTTRTQAKAELDVLAARIFHAHPSTGDDGFRFEQAGSLPPRDRSAILLFLAALMLVAGLVLCIAGGNVANLFMAQAAGRLREISVRLALGATHRHLLQQMLVESVLLALVGGACGVALSVAATRCLAAFRFPAPVPLDLSIAVDSRVLLFSFVLSLLTGIIFGLAPAWTVARAGRLTKLTNILVVAQIAMSVVLLCSTGLFLRSLRHASQIDTGFRSTGVLMMAVDPRLHGYSPERTTQFLNQLRDRVRAIPGIASAAYTDAVPLIGGNRSDGFSVPGQSPVNVELYMAGPDYFETIGTPLIAGRGFGQETVNGPKLAVVNQAFAERVFKSQNPLGQVVKGPDTAYQIIGITKNIKSRFLGEDFRPVLYRSLTQSIAADPSGSGYRILVQFSGNATGMAAAVRREIHTLDPALAIFDARTIEEHLRDALFLPRLGGFIFGAFGILGLSLAAVGLYGVLNSWVTHRTREIGIRLALGARIPAVQWLIVKQGLALTLIALIPGLAAAWAVSKLFTSVLYGIQPHDLPTFTAVPLFLAVVAILACWLPARRASSAEPLAALRHE